MAAAVVVFVAVTGGCLAVYLAMERLPDAIRRWRLERRLREVSGRDEATDLTLLAEAPKGPLPLVDRALRATSAGPTLSRLIEQSGVSTSPGVVAVMCLLAGLAAAIVCASFVPVPVVIVPAALAGGALPIAWLAQQRRARLRRFEEQFPEALDLMARALRSGHAFQATMGMVADELPEPVGVEFRKSFEQQNFGLPLGEALQGLAERVPLLDVRFFVTAVSIQRETGGNLAEILDNLAHVVRERFKILRQVRVHTAHGRFTAYVLLALPAALALALSVINPDHMRQLLYERMGQMMLGGAIVMQSLGYLWIRHVIRIEV